MLDKILKNKEKRDTALLIFMAAIMIAFLVYVFVPFGSSGKKTNEKANKTEQKKPPKKENKIVKESPPLEEPVEETIDLLPTGLNEKIEAELNSLYLSIMMSKEPFENYRTEALRKVLDECKNDTLSRLCKFSFYDLNEMVSMSLPEEYSDSLRFNLFLSLFLIKLDEEGVVKKTAALPPAELEKMVNLDFYSLVGNEVQQDFQVTPVLFYFTMMVKRLPVYPVKDSLLIFKEKIRPVRDLTEAKYLVRIREFLRFSDTRVRFRVQWKEHDAIGADDKKVYGNLNLKVHDFLNQSYLVFPDPRNIANNAWIDDLCDADSGDIELTVLNIMSEEPSNPLQMVKILYSPIDSQFVALLKEFSPGKTAGFLNMVVKNRIDDFQENLTIIDFSAADEDNRVFKAQLDQFGNYLKKSRGIL